MSREPYFEYDNVGKLLLSSVNVNDTLKFVGSNGSYREYNVLEIEKKKETVQDCSWNTGSCKTYYHYDHTVINFLRTDSTPPLPNSPLTYSLHMQMQLPDGIDKANIPNGVQAKTVVYGGAFIDFNSIPAPPGPSGWINFPDFYQPLTVTSFSNSVRTYTDVVVIKSGNNSVYIEPIHGTNYTVNEIWFDKKYGFVFFKDVFGNTWSREN